MSLFSPVNMSDFGKREEDWPVMAATIDRSIRGKTEQQAGSRVDYENIPQDLYIKA